MKEYISNETGRTFILRMEKGDLLREEIVKLCKKIISKMQLYYPE